MIKELMDYKCSREISNLKLTDVYAYSYFESVKKEIEYFYLIEIFNLINEIRSMRGFDIKNNFYSSIAHELEIKNVKIPLDLILSNGTYIEIEELVSEIFQNQFQKTSDLQKGLYLRKKRGVFHTPYEVASLIAMEALTPIIEKIEAELRTKPNKQTLEKLYDEFINLKIIDPACGTGIILSATIDTLYSINKKFEIDFANIDNFLYNQEFLERIVTKNIYGIDINNKATAVTRAILNSKYLKEYTNLESNIICGDSLAIENVVANGKFSLIKSFPNIFNENNGFNIVVMNPPYERLKTDISSFCKINDGSDLYNNEKKETINLARLIRTSKQYPLSDKGVLDLYKLFIDRAIQITNPAGSIAFISPISLVGDISCSSIRKYIIDNARITNVYCIPESTKIFKGVSQAFCILGIHKGQLSESFCLFDKVSNIKPLKYDKNIKIFKSDIRAICPKTLSFPLTDKHGLEILRKIHKYPSLKNHSDIVNMRGELDLTLGKKYISSDSSKEILIRGNLIKPYNIKLENQKNISYVDLDRLIRNNAVGAKNKFINSKRIVGQQIANMALKKRLRFAFCSEGVVGNSCNFIAIKGKTNLNLYFLLGLFNSMLLNWRFKLTSTNNHVNNYEIDDLPIVNINSKNQKWALKIIDLAKEQCNNYSEESQQKIDFFIFLMYGLDSEDIKYIAESEYGHGSYIKFKEIFEYEKNNL